MLHCGMVMQFQGAKLHIVSQYDSWRLLFAYQKLLHAVIVNLKYVLSFKPIFSAANPCYSAVFRINWLSCLVEYPAYIHSAKPWLFWRQCKLKKSCELNCTSKGFSCNFLDLAVRQSPQGFSCDIFDKRSQPEYAGIEMIRLPHVHSNISITAKLGVINIQFYRFLRLCSCKKFFVFQMVSLIVLLKVKGYPLKILLKRTRGLLNEEKILFGTSAFGVFRMILRVS
jgi:hypothetical protein